MSTIRRVFRLVASIASLAMIAGCSSAARENDTMKDAFDALMKRPNLTQVEAGAKGAGKKA